MRRARVQLLLRLAGRLGATGIALLVVVLVGIQFARLIGENMTLSNELVRTNADVAVLQKRRAYQERELRRLSNPQGAIPDIHERLRLVRPNEAIVFVRPMPSASP